jgi:hypothetical protein
LPEMIRIANQSGVPGEHAFARWGGSKPRDTPCFNDCSASAKVSGCGSLSRR